MKPWMLMGLCALAACSPKPADKTPPAVVASGATSPEVVATAAAAQTLDCSMPAALHTTAKEFKVRYGAKAVAGDLAGPEGTTFKGMTLNPGSKTGKLDISWWDKAQTVVSMVRARQDGTGWSGPSGIHVGSTVAEVEAANGKPFKISGFGWDYGGYADLSGGTLEPVTGGCHLSLRFDNPDFKGTMPDGISGDGVQVPSNDARLRTYAPVVTEMSIGWALPEGVTAAD